MSYHELLRELPYYDDINISRKERTFRGYGETYEVEIINNKNLSDSLSVSKNSIKKLFDELLREKRGFKYIISVKITLNPAGKYWSPGRPPPTSRGRPLKILFDRPRDVPIRRPGVVLK